MYKHHVIPEILWNSELGVSRSKAVKLSCVCIHIYMLLYNLVQECLLLVSKVNFSKIDIFKLEPSACYYRTSNQDKLLPNSAQCLAYGCTQCTIIVVHAWYNCRLFFIHRTCVIDSWPCSCHATEPWWWVSFYTPVDFSCILMNTMIEMSLYYNIIMDYCHFFK